MRASIKPGAIQSWLVGTPLGYTRVSTAGQDVASQDDALSAAGCWKVWTDVASGVRADRPQLALVLEALQPGNTLLPRLDTARSLASNSTQSHGTRTRIFHWPVLGGVHQPFCPVL